MINNTIPNVVHALSSNPKVVAARASRHLAQKIYMGIIPNKIPNIALYRHLIFCLDIVDYITSRSIYIDYKV